jgi:formylglycine-generating enzyme required for sulfatase activity
MGGQPDQANEKPVHTVTIIKPFWISDTEITFAQYTVYAQAQGLEIPSDEGWGGGQHPVINVSWHEAKAYAAWLSETNGKGLQCRLPSEAEWEYAARGGSRMAYSWGEKVGKNNAHCQGCGSRWEGKPQSIPVAAFKANDFGLYDMHGNVAEWVEDIWHSDYQGAPTDGSAWQSGDKVARRVIRGGSWADEPANIRSAHRASTPPAEQHNSVGFRMVCRLADG